MECPEWTSEDSKSPVARSFSGGGDSVNLGRPVARVLAAHPTHAMRDAMADQRTLQAIERIESALARIEAAARPQPAPQDDSALRELRQTHQALRGKVEGAISQIDRLLVMNEGG